MYLHMIIKAKDCLVDVSFPNCGNLTGYLIYFLLFHIQGYQNHNPYG